MGVGRLFLILSLLNLFDGFATYIGMQSGLIEEYNPLMSRLIAKDPSIFLLLKFSLSLFLIILSNHIKGIYISKGLRGLLTVALGLYSIVAVVHITWLLV